MEFIPYGYCHCGCGQKTNLARKSHNPTGAIEGEPSRYRRGHSSRKYRDGERTCQQCGKAFRTRSRTQRFCSYTCMGAAKRVSVEERFWSHVDKGSLDDCWLWMASDGHGYGQLSHNGTFVRAHRFSWELHKGPIPDGLLVLHECDVRYPPDDFTSRRCVNPAHLKLGTHAENQREKALKGRGAMGVRGGRAKLTDEKVREIRRLYAAGVPRKQLASTYDVNVGTIHAIASRKTWKYT